MNLRGSGRGVTVLLRPIGPARGAGRPADDVTGGLAGIGARRRGATAQWADRMPPVSGGHLIKIRAFIGSDLWCQVLIEELQERAL